MAKILDDAVTSPDGGDTYDFRCPGIAGSLCGDKETGVPFTSTGWPTKKDAAARGQEHFDEHKGVAVTTSLEEFRAKHNLVQHPDGLRAVRMEDLP